MPLKYACCRNDTWFAVSSLKISVRIIISRWNRLVNKVASTVQTKSFFQFYDATMSIMVLCSSFEVLNTMTKRQYLVYLDKSRSTLHCLLCLGRIKHRLSAKIFSWELEETLNYNNFWKKKSTLYNTETKVFRTKFSGKVENFFIQVIIKISATSHCEYPVMCEYEKYVDLNYTYKKCQQNKLSVMSRYKIINTIFTTIVVLKQCKICFLFHFYSNEEYI